MKSILSHIKNFQLLVDFNFLSLLILVLLSDLNPANISVSLVLYK